MPFYYLTANKQVISFTVRDLGTITLIKTWKHFRRSVNFGGFFENKTSLIRIQSNSYVVISCFISVHINLHFDYLSNHIWWEHFEIPCKYFLYGPLIRRDILNCKGREGGWLQNLGKNSQVHLIIITEWSKNNPPF